MMIMMNTNKYGYVSRTEARIFGELDRKPKKSRHQYDHKKDHFKGSGFVKTQVRHYDHNEGA